MFEFFTNWVNTINFLSWRMIIWYVVIAAGSYIIYDKFFKKKAYCFARLTERIGEQYVEHSKLYPVYLKRSKQDDNLTTVKWTFIDGIKQHWRMPTNKEMKRDNQGRRFIHLIWYGGNQFRVCHFNDFRYNITGKQVIENKTQYIADKVEDNVVDILPDDMKMISRIMDDDLNQLYKNESIWDLLKPYMTLAIVGLVCVMMVYLTTNSLSSYSAQQEKSSNMFVSAIDKFTNVVSTTKVDSNTEIKSGTQPTNTVQVSNK